MIINAREILYAEIIQDLEHQDFMFKNKVLYKDSQFNYMLRRIGKTKVEEGVFTHRSVCDEFHCYKVWDRRVHPSDLDKHKIILKNNKVVRWPRLAFKLTSGDSFIKVVHPSDIQELIDLKNQLLNDKTNIEIKECLPQ